MKEVSEIDKEKRISKIFFFGFVIFHITFHYNYRCVNTYKLDLLNIYRILVYTNHLYFTSINNHESFVMIIHKIYV